MKTFTQPCLNCGENYTTLLKYFRNGRSKYCSKSCSVSGGNALRKGRPLTRDISGENNPNWKGGISQFNSVYTRRFEAKYPEKVRAHNAVHKAIRSGTLKRLPCEHCGSTERIHAHHHDYSKPLDVQWLCQRCHIHEHAYGTSTP